MADDDDARVLHNTSWSDGEQDADEDEWREHHERCCREGDGWSHGFTVSDDVWSHPDPSEGQGQGEGNPSFAFVYEPKMEVVRYYTTENWSKMGDAMSRNESLMYVDVSQCGLTAEGIESLFGRQRSYEGCPLQKLDLGKNPFGSAGMTALLPFLRSRSKIVYLNVSGADLRTAGIRILTEALNHVRVEWLHIRDNEIGDEGIEILLQADNAKHIIELNMVENHIGERGNAAIANFLQRDDTDMKKLLMNCAEDDSARMIVDSISKGSQLEDIFLWSGTVGRDNETVLAALPNIQNLLCNTDSVESLCQSNHRMKWLGINTDSIVQSNPDVHLALDINARSLYGASAVKILRNKLRAFYFRGDYNVQPFAKLDVKLIPACLELVTKTEVCEGKKESYRGFGTGTYRLAPSHDIGAVYHLIRHCHMPELFSYFKFPKFWSLETKMEMYGISNTNKRARRMHG